MKRLAFLVLLLAQGIVHAQQWPNKPVRVIVNVAAGGGLPTMRAGAVGATVVPPGKYPPPVELEVLGVNCVRAVLGASGNRLGNCTRWARSGGAAIATSTMTAPASGGRI